MILLSSGPVSHSVFKERRSTRWATACLQMLLVRRRVAAFVVAICDQSLPTTFGSVVRVGVAPAAEFEQGVRDVTFDSGHLSSLNLVENKAMHEKALVTPPFAEEERPWPDIC